MTTIRNTNERFGEPVEFSGVDLAAAVDAMQEAVLACGYVDQVTEDDYIVVSDDEVTQ